MEEDVCLATDQETRLICLMFEAWEVLYRSKQISVLLSESHPALILVKSAHLLVSSFCPVMRTAGFDERT